MMRAAAATPAPVARAVGTTAAFSVRASCRVTASGHSGAGCRDYFRALGPTSVAIFVVFFKVVALGNVVFVFPDACGLQQLLAFLCGQRRVAGRHGEVVLEKAQRLGARALSAQLPVILPAFPAHRAPRAP